MNKKSFPLLIIPSVFLLDRFFKNLISDYYLEGGGFAVIPEIFHITRVNNTGAAFGMLKGYAPFLTAVSILFVVLLFAYLLKSVFSSSSWRMNEAAWSLVIAGAASNLYDRLRYGYVIDFLDFRIWPVFNLGDASICLGVFLVALGLWKQGKRARAN